MRKLLVFVLVLLSSSAGAVPLAPYRTIENEWFRVAYPAPYRVEAERILGYAMDIREKHAAWLGEFADEKVTIYLSDETNSFATSYSASSGQLYCFLNINAIWAAYPDETGNYVYNLLAHELTHITHLSKTGPVGRIMRAVFGQRYPIALTIPMWFKEGITTSTETRREEFFQEGRGTSPRSRAIVYAMALEGRLPSFDDITGYLNYAWPNVLSTYILGGNFFDYLVETYGLDAVRRLIYGYAVKIIPTFRWSFRDAVGRSLPEVWDEWRDVRRREAEELRRRAAAQLGAPAERLTESGSYKCGIRLVDGKLYTTLRDTTKNRIGLYAVDPVTGAERLVSEDLGTSYIVGGDQEHLYLLSDRGGRTIHSSYYDAYKYHASSGRMIRLTHGLKVSAFDVIDADRLICSSLYVGRPSLFLTSGGGKEEIPLEESIMSVNHIAVHPERKTALLAVTYRDGGTDLELLDLESRERRRITFDRNAKLYPHWVGGERITYATPTDTGIFNQVVQGMGSSLACGSTGGDSAGAGDSAARSVEVTQITETPGGVYWAHHTGSDLYFMSIGADGYDLYRSPIDPEAGARSIDLTASEVMSPAASVEPAGGLRDRRFCDAVNMLDFIRVPYVDINWGNLRDIDVGVTVSSAGIRSTRLDLTGYYKILYPYFASRVSFQTDALFVPLALGFTNWLEVRSPAYIRERYQWWADVSYPFLLGLRSALTIGASPQLLCSRVYRDRYWDPAGLGWIFFPSEYVILDLSSRYAATGTSSIWRNKGLTAAAVFTQPTADFESFAPFQYWNNFDFHLAVPLFDHDYGLKARLVCGLGRDADGGPVYAAYGDASAFLVDRIGWDNGVPFRGSSSMIAGASAALASLELRGTFFSSTFASIGLLPVNLNKLGMLLYSDLLLPFAGVFPADWGAGRLAFGLYLTAEIGLAYQALFMDLNLILHYTMGDPAPSVAFAMDFPK